MTENKRFKSINCGLQGQYIKDEGNVLTIDEVVELLNELSEENKELKIQYNHIREQSNEFHRIARENANRVGKLEKENEQLKRKNQRLEKQKNVLIDYMDNWCPKRFYDAIIKRMEEVE